MKHFRISFLGLIVFSMITVLVFPQLSQAQIGDIQIQVQTVPVDNNQQFNFTSNIPNNANFSITSNTGFLAEDIDNNIYTITQSATAGYTLIDINCNSDNADEQVGNRRVEINLMNEDVTCIFVNVANGTITINKTTDPAGGLNFNFDEDITGQGGMFTLSHGQSEVFMEVPPGQYTVTEDDPTVSPGGFFLEDIVCDDMGTTTDVPTRTVNIDLDSNEEINCTFMNTAQLTGLTMTSTDMPDPVVAGQELRYEHTIMNNSMFTATDVLLVDDLPDGVIGEGIFANIPGVNCVFDTPFNPNNATCEIPNLPPGQDLGITIVVRPDPNIFNDGPTIIENNATLLAEPGDVEINTITQTLVNPVVSIAIDSGDMNRTVDRGRRFDQIYNITVNPDNPPVVAGENSNDIVLRADALDTMLNVDFPPEFNVDTVDTSQGICVIGTLPEIVCNLGDIVEGQTVQVAIVFIAPNERGDFLIEATVTSLLQTFKNFVFIFVRSGDGSDCSLAGVGATGASNLLYLIIPLVMFGRRYWEKIVSGN